MSEAMIVGIGNRFRQDDGLGLEVARRLKESPPPGVEVRHSDGEMTTLMEILADSRQVIFVDALHSNQLPAGSVVRLEGEEIRQLEGGATPTTHGLGLAQALEMASALGQATPRVVLFAVVGRRFEMGEGLSCEVEQALPNLLEKIYQEEWHARGIIDEEPGGSGRIAGQPREGV